MVDCRVALERVFGSSDRSSPCGPGDAYRLNTVHRDLAQIYRVAGEGMTYRSVPLADGSIANLSVHILMPSVGNLRVNQMKNTRVVGPGDIMLVCDWAPFQISTTDEFDMLVINLPGWWGFQNIFATQSSLDDLYLPGSLFATPATYVLAWTIYEADVGPREVSASVATLAQLLRIALEVTAEDQWAAPQVGRIGRILQFIFQNVDHENVSPQDAAKALKCSLRTIHKTCADHGTSFNNLLMEARLSVASYMLATTGSRISDVAFASGFASLSHFCRLFKKRVGESASEYRRRYQKH